MSETIELELEELENAGLLSLIPEYLMDYFKDELNERLVPGVVGDLDSLIETIDANNSFRVLTLNENAKETNDLSSSSSDSVLGSCNTFLIEISARLHNIFAKYSHELRLILILFDSYIDRFRDKGELPSRSQLLTRQKAVLVQSLSTKHFDLFETLFRNVFDFYQSAYGLDSPVFNRKVENENLTELLFDNFTRMNQVL